jgi:hypothetical protein
VSIKSLRRRLDKLGSPDEWYDPRLAAKWHDAAGARLVKLLLSKDQPLTENEKREVAHLEACREAWNRKHFKRDGSDDFAAFRDPTITDEERSRAWQLSCRTIIGPELSAVEQQELAALDARLKAERQAARAAGYRDPMQDVYDEVCKGLAAQDSSRGDDISDIRGWIGVRSQVVTDDIADGLGLKKAEGALVAEAQSDSPAAKAGVLAGDVITAVDGKDVKHRGDFVRKIRAMAPGTEVKLSIQRRGEEKTMSLTLGQQPDPR